MSSLLELLKESCKVNGIIEQIDTFKMIEKEVQKYIPSKFISWKYMGSNNNSLIWSDLFSILGHTLIELDAEPILSREIRLHWQELHISQSNLYIHPNIIFCALNEKK